MPVSASGREGGTSDARLDRPTRVVMLGGQGSGKGTQCDRLAQRFGLVHLSTGALFREAVAQHTDLGSSVENLVAAGHLVPDGLVLPMVAERLSRADVRTHGFVLDGFPRTVQQAQALARLLESQIDVAINLAVNPRVGLERLLRRRVCVACGRTVQQRGGSDVERCPDCGGRLLRRDDDTRSVIARRLALYDQQTKPLLAWYARQGLLVTVDAHGSSDEVAGRIERACSALSSRGHGLSVFGGAEASRCQ